MDSENPQVALLPRELVKRVTAAIDRSRPAWEEFVDATRAPTAEGGEPGPPLAVKYIPSERAKDYLPKPSGQPVSYPFPWPPPDPPGRGTRQSPTKGIFIGNRDYTWGKAVYVTGIHQPLSTATYGRVGLVSYFNPAKIHRVFDARDQDNYEVYLEWLQWQPLYSRALLTVHTNHWLHGLRNDFRTQFEIDVVMCSPDEQDVGMWYTDLADTWLCVSDFVRDKNKPGYVRLRDKFSKVFPDVRFTVVIEEEFVNPNEKDPKLPIPRPPAWPASRVRQLAVSGRPPRVPTVNEIGLAYWQGRIVRVQS